ncbi:hypothetical protein CCH79_00006212 [Xyrichtys novacula]|uniref:arylamine N-acetyltransferase n=1 Tax=Xyrichtys novacula TaxID=13765 RepID=A0AAV1EJ79_XYRNO|nr:hypothetical protein CCH79_00006212 [Xyrichtys novacula]
MSQLQGKMSLEEYMRRIDFHGSFRKPDLETLKMVHKQHVMTVPFENLSMHCGERIVLDIEVAYNKIVRSNRGGWCLENNYLFGWVLREMGYDCTTLKSKCFMVPLNDYSPIESHLIHKVVIDGKAYLADVSYGMTCQLWEPLELISGKDQPQGPGVFRLIEEGGFWALEKTNRKLKILDPNFTKTSLINRLEAYPIHRFTLEPTEVDSFLYINDKLQTDPASIFSNKYICSLQTPTGVISLIGWTYSEITFKPEEGVDYYDMREIKEDEVDQILQEKFKIKLQKKLTPVANKSCHNISQPFITSKFEAKMNLEEYFRRTDFHGSFSKPDLETLKMVHKQHVMTIPFENLSMHCGERMVLDLEVTYNKIVRSNRGGWCLESNHLFGWVLKEMGYDCTTLTSRTYMASHSDYLPFKSHLILKVVIDGKAYIADVSYGLSGELREPLELISGKDQPQASGVFRLIEEGGTWVLERTGRKPKILDPDFAKSSLINRSETNPLYRFTLEPTEIDSFLYINDKLQTDPASIFSNKYICSLQTPTGFISLIGWTYSEITFRPEEGVDYYEMRDIKEDEVDQILQEKFKIKLQKKLTPVGNRSWYTM